MSDQSSRDLASELLQPLLPSADALSIRPGVVTALTGNTVTVTIGGTPIPLVPFYSGAEPVIGATVEVLFVGKTPRIIGTVGVPQWHYVGAAGEPAFQNSWTATNGRTSLDTTSAVSEGSVRFCKDSNGFVHLDGQVHSGTLGQSCFTLPTEFVPQQRQDFPCLSNSAAGVIVIPGVYNTDTPGRVICLFGSNVYFQLSGLVFYAG